MDNLLLKINQLYGLNVHSFEKVTKGCLSENHILNEENKKYFLKKYRFDNSERIEEIHSVKKYFASGGIPVILPIINNENKTYFLHNNGYYSLFPFVSDKQLERGGLTNTAIISLGKMLGRIHLLGRDAKLFINDPFKNWDKEKALAKIKAVEVEINKKSHLTDFDKLALETVLLKKKLILGNILTYNDSDLPANHLIHGDYLDQNVFFNSDGEVSNIFDFEKTNYSPRMYELFRSMMYAFPCDQPKGSDVDKAKLYLKSYLSIYPANKEELKKGLKLFYLKNIHSVWIESEHYLKNNNRADEFVELDLRRIKYLSKYFTEFEEELLRDLVNKVLE